MSENTIPIPARLKNVSIGGHVAGAEDIIDDALNKEQSVVNRDRIEDVATLDGKIALEKQRAEGVEGGLNTRLQTVEQLAEISIGGGDAQIATGADFDNPDATKRAKVPTVGAIVDGLNDGVYDVSKRNPSGGPNSDGKFTLDYILSNADTLIPTGWRHGGMTISFVDSSDNKYVQFRYMSSSTAVADFTNVANWQGVDNVPTVGSKNLIESKGVYESVTPINYVLDINNSIADMTLVRNGLYNGVITTNKITLSCTNYIKVIPGSLLQTPHASDITIRVQQYDSEKHFVGYNDSYADISEKQLRNDCEYVRISASYSGRGYTDENPVAVSDFVEGDFGAIVAKSGEIERLDAEIAEIYEDFTDPSKGYIDDDPKSGSAKLITSNAVSKYLLNNLFVGANNTGVSTKIYGLTPGHTYRLYFFNNVWDMTGVTNTGIQIFWILNIYNSADTDLKHVNKGTTPAAYYDFTVPANSDYIVIGGRATSGVAVRFQLEDLTYIGSITESTPTLNSTKLITSGAVKTVDNNHTTQEDNIVTKKYGKEYEFTFNVTQGTAVGWRDTQRTISISLGSRIAVTVESEALAEVGEFLFWAGTIQDYIVHSNIGKTLYFTIDKDVTAIAFYVGAVNVIASGTATLKVKEIVPLYFNDEKGAVFDKGFIKLSELPIVSGIVIGSNGASTSSNNSVALEMLLPVDEYNIDGNIVFNTLTGCGQTTVCFYSKALIASGDVSTSFISRSAQSGNPVIAIPSGAKYFRFTLYNSSKNISDYALDSVYLRKRSIGDLYTQDSEKVSFTKEQTLTDTQKETAQRNIGMFDDKSVYQLNPDIPAAIVSAKSRRNYPYSGYDSMLSFLIMTDIHSAWDNFERGLQYADDESLIDGVLVLGDVCNTPAEMRTYDYSSKILGCSKPVLTIPGNHEVADGAGQTPLTDAEMIEKFYNSDLITKNGDVHPTGKLYWYRDFTKSYTGTSGSSESKTVRVVGITEVAYNSANEYNTWSIAQEQIDWLVDLLDNTPSDYYVMIIQHSSLPYTILTQVDGKFKPKLYNYTSVHTTTRPLKNDSFLANIINAWISGGSVNETSEEWNNISVSVNHTFASAHTGKFVGIISGHDHDDCVFRVTAHPEIIDISLNCTTNTKAHQSSEICRSYDNNKSYDCLTVVTFDWFNDSIKLIRVGADVTSAMEKRDYQMVIIDEN